MAYQIIWTDEAKHSFQSIIEYIQNKFPEKAVTKFVTAVNAKIDLIKASPASYRKSTYSNYIHYTNIFLRKTILVYRIDEEKNIVVLIHFWDARRNPKLMNV